SRARPCPSMTGLASRVVRFSLTLYHIGRYEIRRGLPQGDSRMDATPSLIDLLRQFPDPRRAEGKRHPLTAVLSLLVLSLLAGMRGLQGVVEFGRNLPPDVVAALGFTRTKTLAKSTLSEILRAIDIEAFESLVSRWLQAQANRHGWTAMAI